MRYRVIRTLCNRRLPRALALGVALPILWSAAVAEGVSTSSDPVLSTGGANKLVLAALKPDASATLAGKATELDVGDLELAPPEGADTFKVGYEIYVGGFQIANIDMAATTHDGRYLAAGLVTTKGLADAFASSNIQLISLGELVGPRVAPRTYNSDQISPEKRQLVGLAFNQDGPTALDSNPPYDTDRYPVKPELKYQAVDPLSAALHLTMRSSATESEPCGKTIPIFDGRRRYNLQMSYVGEEEISLGRNSFNGGAPIPALHCKVKYERLAGFKPPKPNSKTANFPPIDLWLAPFEGTDFYVPVRVQVSTQFGGVVARAVKLTVDDGKG